MPSAESVYAEQMRLDAVKAEADRKARQKQGMEVGLPALAETEPLTSKQDPDEIYIDEGDKVVAYRPNTTSPPIGAGVGAGAAAYARQGSMPPGRQQSPYNGGYAQAAPGTRAVDDYYNARPQAGTTYPPQPQPQPRRQTSGRTQSSGYMPSPYPIAPVPPMPTTPSNLNAVGTVPLYNGNQYGHNQYTSTATAAQDYAHSRGDTCTSITHLLLAYDQRSLITVQIKQPHPTPNILQTTPISTLNK